MEKQKEKKKKLNVNDVFDTKKTLGAQPHRIAHDNFLSLR